MSTTTPTSSDRPSSSDTSGGASSQFSQSPYGAVADKASSSTNAMGSKSQTGSAQSGQNSGAQSAQGGAQNVQNNGAHADGAQEMSRDALHDLAEHAQQLCHESMESMKTYISQHPVSSVGIAMAAGCVISMMLREGSSMRDHSRH